MKLFYVSLGCPKNSIDLEEILGHLKGDIEVVEQVQEADAALVNTCAFITAAKQESIETILELAALKEEKPEFRILVAGCLPQRYREELAPELPEVDAFFSSREASRTALEIGRFLGTFGAAEAGRYRLTPRHYAYLRIAEGCDNRCSYCAIPLIKGGFHSRPLPEIIREARQLCADGARELLIVAQDTTAYGRDLTEALRLHDVLYALEDVAPVHWIRLLYTHPAHWYPELIDAMADLPKVLPYIDLPIQHISERLLKAMGRKSGRSHIEKLIGRLRQRIPSLALRTSLIVGFPGESDADFSELCEFVTQTAFERLGVFTYSHEEGTAAEGREDALPESEKKMRQDELMEIQAGISLAHNQALVGRSLEVVVDALHEDGSASARTIWDAPEIDNSVILAQGLPAGTFARVTCTGADVYDLYARSNDIGV